MRIVHIASELAPLAKVGGLADVVLGLSRELSWKGHEVEILIPAYDCLDAQQITDRHIVMDHLLSFYKGEWFSNTVWSGTVEQLRVLFIEPHHSRRFFERGCIYGAEDDIERFLCFARAAIEFLYKRSVPPDIIHLHDWQAAVIAPLVAEMYRPLGFTHPKTVLTIHNMNYQGKCLPADLSSIGLEGGRYHRPEALQDDLDGHLVNLLKGGIVYADGVTTVSPNYANEVMRTDEGRGLQAALQAHAHKFKGILNGLDYSYWNPETDRFLSIHYSAKTMTQAAPREGAKSQLKGELRAALRLAQEQRPLISCIARLIPQKGIEMIKHVLHTAAERKSQCILLGSSPIPHIEAEFQALQQQYAHHPHVRLILQHEEALAHLIYAGSDIFIVPSLFEPCGLTQLIALRYGTVPVVRRTGGLADTIADIETSDKQVEERNGYVFDAPDAQGIDSALDRAIACWFDYPKQWHQLVCRGMRCDFSWNHPTTRYLLFYEQLLHGR